MISIVIATHGDPRLLDLTLEAAAQATAADVEYVLVGDVEAAVARRAGQPHGSRLVTVHCPDLGRVAALNEGLARTSGELVSLLAAGDLHFEETLRVIHEAAAGHPGIDCFYGDTMIVDPAGRMAAELNTPDRTSRRGQRHCRFCAASTFIRRATIERLGWLDPQYPFWAEYDLWLRLDQTGARFRQVPRLLACRHRPPRTAAPSDFSTVPVAASLDELMAVRVRRRDGRLSPSLLAWYGTARAALKARDSGRSATIAHARTFASEALQRWGDGTQPGPRERLVLSAKLVKHAIVGKALHEFTVAPPEPLAAKRFQFVRRKIFRLMHHAPRHLRVPARYARAMPPATPPVISIVTPSFNQGHVLEETLRSVLDQGYPALQYVVQDGGSTDASVSILERYATRLFAWESARDGGQSAAINRGLRRTTGEIMAYLNSDDILLPGSLAYVADFFERHPDVDVVYGHRVLIDDAGAEVGRWVLPPHDDRVIAFADFIPQETMFWRRRAWEAVGGIDESFRFAMDWDLILRFRAAGMTFRRLPRFLGAFRVWPDQKSVSWWLPVGRRETERLTARTLGATPTRERIRSEITRYVRRHWVLDKLYLAGLVRY
jgi:glycosyltransferase involved in cell wall biosynthesis